MKRNSNFLNKNSESISTKMTLNSQKLLAGILSLVLVAGLASPAFALTIDDFTTGTNDITANSGDPLVFNFTSGLPVSETIGESRNVTAMWVSGGLDVMANSNPNPGIMGFSSDDGVTGIFKLAYNGTGSGLGGVDLTLGGAGDRIIVNMTTADLNSGISVWLTDTNDVLCSLELTGLGAGAQVVNFPYASFDTPVNCENVIDFTSINTIEVQVNGIESGDYSIDLIGVPQTRVGGTVGSMSTTSLLVAGAQANMGLWSLALVGIVGAGAAITYKLKSNKAEQ